MAKNIIIRKSDGEKEEFDVDKLLASLEKTRGSQRTIHEAAKAVRQKVRPGMKTSDIYKTAYGALKKLERPAAARYSMKRAILDLGPSGFPFEDFVAEIFRAKGFAVERGKMMMGACSEHEVDIVMQNARSFIVGELKFHNDVGIKTDLKVALYVHARVEDLRKYRAKRGERHIDEGWLVTNTSFTKSAIHYAHCTGLKTIGWTYPRYGNLQDLIEETRLHPITCLTSLSKNEKMALMQKGVILCNSIEENRRLFESVGISGTHLRNAFEEGRALCGGDESRV